jgi:MFS family permease
VVDAVSFLSAAALIFAIRPTTSARPSSPIAGDAAAGAGSPVTAPSALAKLAGEWRDGMAVLRADPVLRALAVFALVTQFGEGLVGTLFVPWATDVLHTDASGYGSLLSAQAIGGLAGAVAIGRLGARLEPRRLLVIAAVTFGLIDLVLFTYPVLFPFIGPALVGMVVVGLPAAAIGTAFTTLQQTGAPDSHRGRVIGALGALGALSSLFGAVGAGVLGESIPIVALLVVQGSGYVIAGLAFAALTRRGRA